MSIERAGASPQLGAEVGETTLPEPALGALWRARYLRRDAALRGLLNRWRESPEVRRVIFGQADVVRLRCADELDSVMASDCEFDVGNGGLPR